MHAVQCRQRGFVLLEDLGLDPRDVDFDIVGDAAMDQGFGQDL